MRSIYKISFSFLIFVIAVLSCDKMEDNHTAFLENGEIIYAIAPDTLQAFGGRNRIQLKWLVNNGNNITKCIVEWMDYGELKKKEVDVKLNTPTDSVYITIENLEEKSYLFYAYNIDKDGNRSIKKQVTGSAYGEVYESTLSNRPLLKMEGGGTVDSVIIKWGTPSEKYIATEIKYQNNVGEILNKKLFIEDYQTIIKNWKPEGTLEYRSLYVPVNNAIDTFYTDFNSITLPVFIDFKSEKIDKTDWEIIDFSSQAAPYYASNTIDNNIGTFWHTQYAGIVPNYPHHFTFDMKRIVKMDKIECFRRQGDGNGQTKFQLYTSLDGITFESHGVFDFNSLIDEGQIYYFSSLPDVRFIKYEATEGPSKFAFLAEINVYGQLVQD